MNITFYIHHTILYIPDPFFPETQIQIRKILRTPIPTHLCTITHPHLTKQYIHKKNRNDQQFSILARARNAFYFSALEATYIIKILKPILWAVL